MRILIAGAGFTVAIWGLFAPSIAFSSPAESARWCLDTATKIIKDQPMTRKGSDCPRWVKQYGFRHQNDLAREAVSFAKGGDNQRAVERIMICQCHNGNARAEIQRDPNALISYLKTR